MLNTSVKLSPKAVATIARGLKSAIKSREYIEEQWESMGDEQRAEFGSKEIYTEIFEWALTYED